MLGAGVETPSARGSPRDVSRGRIIRPKLTSQCLMRVSAFPAKQIARKER